MDYSYTNMLAQLNVGSAHPGGLSATIDAWEKIKKYPHHVILDAGCGTGRTLEFLNKVTNAQIIGIDQNEEMINKAKQRLKNTSVDLRVGNLEELPFENETFDCILSESVISFNPIERILQEYNRVLRLEGMLYLIEITTDDTLTEQEQKDLNLFYGTKEILTANQWIHSIEQAGFSIIESSPLPATSDGQVNINFNEKIDPIYYDYLSHHFHIIDTLQTKLIGHQFYCQKKKKGV